MADQTADLLNTNRCSVSAHRRASLLFHQSSPLYFLLFLLSYFFPLPLLNLPLSFTLLFSSFQIILFLFSFFSLISQLVQLTAITVYFLQEMQI